MCSDGVNFAEGDSYDFARCIKTNGEIYGVSPGETCRGGKPISDAKADKKGGGKTGARMSKLRAAFIKKLGREMSSKELEKARNMINRLGEQGGGKGIASLVKKMTVGSEKD